MYCKYDESQWNSRESWETTMKAHLVDEINQKIEDYGNALDIAADTAIERCWQLTGIEFEYSDIENFFDQPKEDGIKIHPDDITMNFENNGDITMMHPDIPDQLIARVDSEGDIHVEDDAPGFITQDLILSHLEHALSMALELRDVDWTPDVCFLRAAGRDTDWSWDDATQTWSKV
jgi:hypothetical protein